MAKITQEELEKYSPHLLDMLARYYKYIDKFKDSHPSIDFTENGCRVAFFALGGDIHKKNFIDKFLENLDIIKKIAEEMPNYEIKCSFTYTDEEGEVITKIETTYYETYDTEKLETYLTRGGVKGKLISCEKIN